MPDNRITVYDTRHEAVAAIRQLKREGVPASSITVMSSEPLHLEASASKQSRIPGFAIAGGFAGAVAAILLTVITSRRVDLITGGMPIVTPWAFGIIVFELTALGAILATLGRMIYEARLIRPRLSAEHEDSVADGRIVIAVSDYDNSDRNS
jgi:hypothetical protein